MFFRPRTLAGLLRRHTRVALLGAALLVLLAVAGWRGGRSLWAGHHLRAARQCLERRDFAAARAHLAVCLAVWPDDGPTHLLAARCARRAGRYDEAERHLKRCRALQGPTPQATLEGALLQVQRGELGEAENYLKRTITPDHPDAALVLEALALGYLKTNRLASLLECTDLWLQVRAEDPQALRWRGYAFEGFRDADKARDCYERAVAADPLADDARLALAQLLLERFNRGRDALPHFEQLRQRRPEDPAVLLGLARCYRWLGRPDQAEQTIDALLTQPSHRAEALAERGKLALETGRPREAERWFRESVALRADDREALYGLVQCLEQLGEEEEAREGAERLKRLEADLARLSTLVAAVGRSPNDPGLRCEAGRICLRYGKDADGLHWLSSALDVAPGHAPTHAALADYYERQGRSDQAAMHRRLSGAADRTPADK
jgi:tetratricopeptide (TPR) repeat protein